MSGFQSLANIVYMTCNAPSSPEKDSGLDTIPGECRPKVRNSLDCTNSLATFLLQKEAQEKSYQKRTPIRGFRPLRRATNARALDRHHLLKKVDENFCQTDETHLFCLQSALNAFAFGDRSYALLSTIQAPPRRMATKAQFPVISLEIAN